MKIDRFRNWDLDGDPFYLPGGRTGVLLLHGFTATTTEVRPLAEYLNATGYTISAPLLKGHGTDPDDLNKTTWQDWLESAETAYQALSQNCSQVFLGGESMGGLLALLLASRYPKIAGLMLYAPALIVPKLTFAHIIKFFQSYIPKTGKSGHLPWKGYGVYPSHASVQLLKLQKEARHCLSSIHQPTLIVMGTEDYSVRHDVPEILSRKIASKDKEILRLEGSPHVLLLAPGREKAFEASLEFVSSRSSQKTQAMN